QSAVVGRRAVDVFGRRSWSAHAGGLGRAPGSRAWPHAWPRAGLLYVGRDGSSDGRHYNFRLDYGTIRRADGHHGNWARNGRNRLVRLAVSRPRLGEATEAGTAPRPGPGLVGRLGENPGQENWEWIGLLIDMQAGTKGDLPRLDLFRFHLISASSLPV